MKYLKQLLLWLDHGANVLLGGYADETISARSWRLKDKSKFWGTLRKVVDTLFWFDKDHCRTSYESEMYRKQLPAEYRIHGKQQTEPK